MLFLTTTEKRWRISYSGKLLSYGTNHLGNHNVPPSAVKGEEKEHQVEIDFEWVSTTKTYHSGTFLTFFSHFLGRDLDQWSSAVSMSEMKWSKEYFNNLKFVTFLPFLYSRSENQTRIEQGGNVQGIISIDGKTVCMFEMAPNTLARRSMDWCSRPLLGEAKL